MRAETPSAASARQSPSHPGADAGPEGTSPRRPHRSRHLLIALAVTMLVVPVIVTEVLPSAAADPAPPTSSTAPLVEEIVDTVAELVSVSVPVTEALVTVEAPTTTA